MEHSEHGEKTGAIAAERRQILERLEGWMEGPMVGLGFIWLALFVVEVIWGLSPLLERLGTVIWGIFLLDFLLRLALTPDKSFYLKRNWLTAVSLLLPALRVVRIVRLARMLRAARAVRGMRLVRILSSLNRGMRALGASFGRRGFGYVALLTVIVTAVGAAGMYGFENDPEDGRGLQSYGDALWWTAMLMTTIGSEYWPRSPEGRVLALLLSLFATAVFGYVTATIATYFIGREAEEEKGEIAGEKSIERLHAEIVALRSEIRSLTGKVSKE